MEWPAKLIEISFWALKNEDLRHRYIYSKSAEDLRKTPGIAFCLETSAVLSIFEAALGKGFTLDTTISREKNYPDSNGSDSKKRADLAIKDIGQGQNWAYVEVKKYVNRGGKNAIAKDLSKLKAITRKCQRWMLIYRIRTSKESNKIEALLKKNFSAYFDFRTLHVLEFDTLTKSGRNSKCEIALCRII